MAEPSLNSRTKRRLFGIDRSGPPPAQTLSGQPLNPWTLPNAIGFIRLAMIPVFLIVALSSVGGHDALAVVLFGSRVKASDLLDAKLSRPLIGNGVPLDFVVELATDLKVLLK